VKFWIKSAEGYYLPKCLAKSDTTYMWSQVKSTSGLEYGLLDVFPNMPANAYHDTDDVKTDAKWLSATAALYGDPNEVLLWMFGGSGSSSDQFPHSGRSLYVVPRNLWGDEYRSKAMTEPGPDSWATSHLPHELGQSLSLRHLDDGFNTIHLRSSP
jgi:hypothetical protein